jgi:hypothetical protein
MRILLLVLCSALAVFAEDPQAPATPASQAPDHLSIPAELSKTIDTNKCKAGDAVEMRTLAPVLIANGVVMPENTKLQGKVAAAASRQKDRPSWLLLIIQRAEWKDHSLALRAFITSQITMKADVEGQDDSTFQGALNLPDNFYRRRSRGQNYPTSDLAVSAAHPVRDWTVEGGQTQQLSYQRLDDVRLIQDKNGRVFLLSQKDHLKLPSGTMFVLQNRPLGAQSAAPAATPAGNVH